MVILESIFNNIIKETGIRNINTLSQRYDKAKIYFHMDTDGVTSAIGMKYYLESNGIEVVDCEVIQYGDKEFSIKKPSAKGDIMPVLVDFAHGKPMFVIHTDHHDKQIGSEKEASKSFRQSRSNVETISQILPKSDLFPYLDVLMVSTIDSANFATMGITPDDVMKYVFLLDKEKDLESNKKAMALVVNKLILAYKNKPKFLEKLVMMSTPSLVNIFHNIVKLAKEDGYVSPEIMAKNSEEYVKLMKNTDIVKYDEKYGIISQYGGGELFKPGAYDRYVPFKNHPDANFLIMVWPMGILQVSCNPFKGERTLKGVNLGEISEEVLKEYESELKNIKIDVNSIKYFSEKDKSFSDESVGFTFKDMVSIYGDTEGGIEGLDKTPEGSSPDYTIDRWVTALKNVMNKQYISLNEREKKALTLLKISAWDIIKANSGGHKCITNISGLTYLGKESKPWLLKLSRSFGDKLREKINNNRTT
jgi:hypothetical protein